MNPSLITCASGCLKFPNNDTIVVLPATHHPGIFSVYFLLASLCVLVYFFLYPCLMYHWLSFLWHCQVVPAHALGGFLISIHYQYFSWGCEHSPLQISWASSVCNSLLSSTSAMWTLTILASQGFQLSLLNSGRLLTFHCVPIPRAANWKLKLGQLQDLPFFFF